MAELENGLRSPQLSAVQGKPSDLDSILRSLDMDQWLEPLIKAGIQGQTDPAVINELINSVRIPFIHRKKLKSALAAESGRQRVNPPSTPLLAESTGCRRSSSDGSEHGLTAETKTVVSLPSPPVSPTASGNRARQQNCHGLGEEEYKHIMGLTVNEVLEYLEKLGVSVERVVGYESACARVAEFRRGGAEAQSQDARSDAAPDQSVSDEPEALRSPHSQAVTTVDAATALSRSASSLADSPHRQWETESQPQPTRAEWLRRLPASCPRLAAQQREVASVVRTRVQSAAQLVCVHVTVKEGAHPVPRSPHAPIGVSLVVESWEGDAAELCAALADCTMRASHHWSEEGEMLYIEGSAPFPFYCSVYFSEVRMSRRRRVAVATRGERGQMVVAGLHQLLRRQGCELGTAACSVMAAEALAAAQQPDADAADLLLSALEHWAKDPEPFVPSPSNDKVNLANAPGLHTALQAALECFRRVPASRRAADATGSA